MTTGEMSVEFTKVVFSEATKELIAAFVKFAADNTNVDKNKANPFFNSQYADLAGAINSSREHLAKYELAVMQHPFTMGDLIGITTILCHSSGQSIASTLLLKPVKTDPQALGSAITYARRYAYMAILGMAAEDDDGNAASQSGQAKQQNKQQAPAQKRQEQPKAAPQENFNIEDFSHIERLEKALAARPEVAMDVYMDIAKILQGRPMTSVALDAAIKGVLEAY